MSCYALYDYVQQIMTVIQLACVCLVTLADALANEVPWKLFAIWQCALGLVKATKKLHEIGLLYLCWRGTCYLISRI